MDEKGSEDDDFQPAFKGKGKGKFGSGPRVVKGSTKRKNKEVRFRVISVVPGTSSTPVNRGDRAKEMWIRADAWNVVEVVTIENKASLVQRLVDEEVIIKRERNLKAFRKGLETLGLLQLVIDYPSLMKPYFVMESNSLTPAEFFSLVKYCFPKTDVEI